MWRKVRLLLWKNLLLWRHHWLLNTLQILVPMSLFIIELYGKTTPLIGKFNQGITDYPVKTEDELRNLTKSKIFCDNCVFAYSPKNERTQHVIRKLEQMLSLVNTEFRAFENEQEIEQLFRTILFNGTARHKFRGAVVFEDGLKKTNGMVSYKIRLVDQVINTNPQFFLSEIHSHSSVNAAQYANSGFIGLQILIDKILANLLTGQTINHNISLQPLPSRWHNYLGNINTFYATSLPRLIMISFCFFFPPVMLPVIGEKSSGMRELLKLYGLPGWLQWMVWMLTSIIIKSVVVTLIIFLFSTSFGSAYVTVINFGNPSVWWVVIYLAALSTSSFAFFISTFFRRPYVATAFCVIFWLSLYDLGLFAGLNNFQFSWLMKKLGFVFLPSMLLQIASKILTAFEEKGIGAHWNNFAEPVLTIETLSLGHITLIFLSQITLYMLLTIYLESISSSKFRTGKPWYYISQINTCRQSNQLTLENETSCEDTDTFSMSGSNGLAENRRVVVEANNLSKTFGSNNVAVDGLSVKVYEGEIFTILGHKGAGKSTLLGMLSGVISPSIGIVKISGCVITSDSFLQNLDLCSQYDMFCNGLTVSQHLRLFGQLEGLDSSQATVESKIIMQKLQLVDKEEVLALRLSPELKRMLSVAIALIGENNIAILDEPTRGMDAKLQRAVWNYILELRGNRTIIVATDSMEEATVLGNRIGILSHGKLQYCGLTSNLNKFYGTGYSLVISVWHRNQSRNVLRYLQNWFLNDPIRNVYHIDPTSMVVKLPTEIATETLSRLFALLNDYQDQLGIKSIGLSHTGLDDTFLNMQEITDEGATGYSQNGTLRSNLSNGFATNPIISQERSQGLTLLKEQFLALFAKKYTYTKRNPMLSFCQIILPIVILAIGTLFGNMHLPISNSPPPLKFTLGDYTSPITLISAIDETMTVRLSSVVGSSAKIISSETSIHQTALEFATQNPPTYQGRYIVAADVNLSNFNAAFNTIPNHAAPLAVNIATNTLLRSLDANNNSNYKIQITNHPFQSRQDVMLVKGSKVQPITFATYMSIGLTVLAATFIIFPVEERLTKVKPLQMMTGVSPIIYWLSAILWDLLIVCILIFGLIVWFLIFENNRVLISFAGACVFILILLIYGFSSISFSYLLSLCFPSKNVGIAVISIIHLVTGLIFSGCIHINQAFQRNNLFDLSFGNYRWIGRLFPNYGATTCLMLFSSFSTNNARCSMISAEGESVLCNPKLSYIPKRYQECCDNCEALGAPCFTPIPFLTWEITSIFAELPFPGIGQELLYMFLFGLAYQFILLILEYGIIERICFLRKNEPRQVTVEDKDVKNEHQRVLDIIIDGNFNDVALIVQNLCKNYGSFEAVSNLSVGLNHGDCFGILRGNRAGKNTIIKMLSGEIFPSNGNVYNSMLYSLHSQKRKFLSEIGYCPQSEGLVDTFTGREMLQLFSRLRGMPENFGEFNKWLRKLDLVEDADLQCKEYSFGMKRRLCLAMAAIGDVPILLLDEPTTGVDAVSRKILINAIIELRNSGRTIILTSQSLGECETLCSRFGVLTDGRLQCIGGVQHLRRKFCRGYNIFIKLKPLVFVDPLKLNRLCAEIQTKLAPWSFKENYQSFLQFQVNNGSISWTDLFKTLEFLKTSNSYNDIIEDYTVNETTLADAFFTDYLAKLAGYREKENRKRPKKESVWKQLKLIH